MRKILSNRIKLLSAIKKSIIELDGKIPSKDIENIRLALDMIRKDTKEFLSLSENKCTAVSFAKVQKQDTSNNKRIVTTLARYIRRNLSFDETKISHDSLDKLAGLVKLKLNQLNFEDQLSFYKGKDIIEQYRTSKAKSCMTGCECEKVEIYALNPDKVTLVVHEEARALLFKTDESVYVLDRVYPAQCHSVQMIRDWAKSKGYVLRKNPDRVVETGCVPYLSNDKVYTLTLKHRNIFPYMDTFAYGLVKESLAIFKNDPTFGTCTFHNIYGKYDKSKICYACEARLNNGDYTVAGDGQLYCFKCFDNMFFCCDYCGESRDASKKIVLQTGHCICENCKKHTTKCKGCNSIDFPEIMAAVNDDHYCYDCYVEVLSGCKKCKKRYPKDEFVVDEICKKCFKYDKCSICNVDIVGPIFIENKNVICSDCAIG